ncbi:fungal-specific transcription factor domain-containing protein [Aspergillus californicus]
MSGDLPPLPASDYCPQSQTPAATDNYESIFTHPGFQLGSASLLPLNMLDSDLDPDASCLLVQSQFPPGSIASNSPEPMPASLFWDLVDIFFDRIQPWLPLFHKPQFLQHCDVFLKEGKFAVQTLGPDDSLLFYSMFALSARFSVHPALLHIPIHDRGETYSNYAKKAYESGRESTEPSLRNLQGCILFAFYSYTSGLSPQGWILVGVCVRIAYDLGLSAIDDQSEVEFSDLAWQERELSRRAWWLLCELDTFGSIIMQRPFAIDRRHRVHLPLSDQDWFSDRQVPSVPLKVDLGNCWQTLLETDNQNERAWYLVAMHIMALAHDRSLTIDGVAAEEKLALENEVACLKLSLPWSSQQKPGNLGQGVHSTRHNWIIGTQLLLSVSEFVTATLPVLQLPEDEGEGGVGGGGSSVGIDMYFSTCLTHLSAILRNWSSDCFNTSHPFFSCAIIPSRKYLSHQSQNLAISSLESLTGLIQERFAEYWPLGAHSLLLRRLVLKKEDPNEEETRLAKRYPVYFVPPKQRRPNGNVTARHSSVLSRFKNQELVYQLGELDIENLLGLQNGLVGHSP